MQFECIELIMYLKQDCVITPWLFSIIVKKMLHETKARELGKETSLNYEGS